MIVEILFLRKLPISFHFSSLLLAFANSCLLIKNAPIFVILPSFKLISLPPLSGVSLLPCLPICTDRDMFILFFFLRSHRLICLILFVISLTFYFVYFASYLYYLSSVFWGFTVLFSALLCLILSFSAPSIIFIDIYNFFYIPVYLHKFNIQGFHYYSVLTIF